VPPRRGELYTSVTLGEFGFDGAALIHGLVRRLAQTADTVPKRLQGRLCPIRSAPECEGRSYTQPSPCRPEAVARAPTEPIGTSGTSVRPTGSPRR